MKPGRMRRLKYRLEYLGMKSILALLGSQPLERTASWGRQVGRFWYRVDRRHRELAVDNISRGLGLDRVSAEAVARRTFENLGRTLAEFASFGRIEELLDQVEIEGEDNLREAMGRGKGIFILSAHFGNWELGVAAISRIVSLTSVARPMKNPLTDGVINDLRKGAGQSVIGHRNATRKILKALGRNEAVGILLDQNTSRQEGIFVDFLGRPASTNSGLALLAEKTGAAIVPIFIVRQGDMGHRITIEPPLELAHLEDRQHNRGVNTARCAAMIESYVRRNPDHWFWVHNRWKVQPLGDEVIYRP